MLEIVLFGIFTTSILVVIFRLICPAIEAIIARKKAQQLEARRRINDLQHQLEELLQCKVKRATVSIELQRQHEEMKKRLQSLTTRQLDEACKSLELALSRLANEKAVATILEDLDKERMLQKCLRQLIADLDNHSAH